MRIARHRAAARNAIAALLVSVALAPAPVLAEGGSQLILPLVTALAVASAARNAPQQVATLEPGHMPLLSLIPSQVRFEDGYEIDVDDYIGRRQPVALVDADRVASFEVFRRPRRGWTMSFAYDEESRGPLAGSDQVLRFVAEFRF
jgi:hypothetical protein